VKVQSRCEWQWSRVDDEVGRLLRHYWELKKVMASPAPTTLKQAKEAPVEPLHIARLSKRLEPLTYGYSLLGAGGGGFMCILTRRSVSECRGEVEGVLAQLNVEERAALAREDGGAGNGSNGVKVVEGSVSVEAEFADVFFGRWVIICWTVHRCVREVSL